MNIIIPSKSNVCVGELSHESALSLNAIEMLIQHSLHRYLSEFILYNALIRWEYVK